jgi:hypothetical protein
MRVITPLVVRLSEITTLIVALTCIPPVVRADAISFQLSSSSLTTTSGGTVTFTGMVTNNSGSALNATDFFFNFNGFDPVSVTPIQDLGVATNFLIPTGTTSAEVALFDVVLGSVVAGSSFPIQVQLEDVNFDLSVMQTATVSVPGAGMPTPEPATLLLLGVGLCGLFVARRTRLKFESSR